MTYEGTGGGDRDDHLDRVEEDCHGEQDSHTLTHNQHSNKTSIFSYEYEFVVQTEREFLSRVRRQREVQHRHRGYEETRHNQVIKIVKCSPAYLDDKSNIEVGFCRDPLTLSLPALK